MKLIVDRIAAGRSLAVIVELVGCVLFWNNILGSSLIQLGGKGLLVNHATSQKGEKDKQEDKEKFILFIVYIEKER